MPGRKMDAVLFSNALLATSPLLCAIIESNRTGEQRRWRSRVETKRSLSIRLFAGLLFSLLALAVYGGYTLTQLGVLRRIQTDVVDRNRRDSLLLLRVQNDLNVLG